MQEEIIILLLTLRLICNFQFPNQKSVYHGKVREVYNINDEILVMIATDRLSAFDVVLPKGIPYKVVQGSGDDNALGILKFNFPNKYSVYLHDTNQRYLFKNAKRALSHGCVRVQDWEKLTYYISALDSVNYESDPKRVVSDSIKVWLERKEKHIVRVKTRLPVYFRYFTAAGKNGKLFFFDDIYHEDKMAREAYFSTK